jgi:geranylgeranyl diphosphate synthase, type II
MRTADELGSLVEEYLGDLALAPELHGQAESVRYALVGGKRVRAVLCLATAEAAGAEAERVLPAAAALELVHAFSLVHDDLPALDNDAERRGRPSTWAQHGEAIAVLAGDALLAEAFRLALSYPFPHVGRELAQATLGMIGGQYLDITGTAPDEATLHNLKTGCLLSASVGVALWAAEVPEREQVPWRAFGDELGLLFQIVDDILDCDGYVLTHGEEGARRLAEQAAARARDRLDDVPADTSVLGGIVDGLATRTS